MNQYEFLTQLDQYLSGKVSDRERMESLQYYREYIDSQIAGGKREEDVLKELGSAYSIGKSIVDAYGNEEGYSEAGDIGENGYGDFGTEEPAERGNFVQLQLEGWKSWLIIGVVILLVIFVLSLVFRIFAALLPFLVPFLIILFVIKLFSDRR